MPEGSPDRMDVCLCCGTMSFADDSELKHTLDIPGLGSSCWLPDLWSLIASRHLFLHRRNKINLSSPSDCDDVQSRLRHGHIRQKFRMFERKLHFGCQQRSVSAAVLRTQEEDSSHPVEAGLGGFPSTFG